PEWLHALETTVSFAPVITGRRASTHDAQTLPLTQDCQTKCMTARARRGAVLCQRKSAFPHRERMALVPFCVFLGFRPARAGRSRRKKGMQVERCRRSTS